MTRDPFLPWKPTKRVWEKARSLGMEVAVSIDWRSPQESIDLTRELADTVIVNEHDYASAGINALLDSATRQFAFWVSDDEEPGTELWKFAANPPYPLAYRVLILCPMSATTHYSKGAERQIRLFPRTAYRWEGDVNGDPVIYASRADLQNIVLWHHSCDAPYEERLAKERFATEVVGDGTSYRYMPERFPESVVPMDRGHADQLPLATLKVVL